MKTRLTHCWFNLPGIGKVYLIPLLIFISSINLFALHDLEVTGNITELGSDYLMVQGYKFMLMIILISEVQMDLPLHFHIFS